MPDPPIDEAAAHRWFAVEANNAGWALVEQPSRTADETERMLHLAHAAALHWSHAGSPINRLRALGLLTAAYHRAGHADTAVRWAESGVALLDQLDDDTTTWDRVTVHAGMAQAYDAAGRAGDAAPHLERAVALADSLDDDDRGVMHTCWPVTAEGAA